MEATGSKSDTKAKQRNQRKEILRDSVRQEEIQLSAMTKYRSPDSSNNI